MTYASKFSVSKNLTEKRLHKLLTIVKEEISTGKCTAYRTDQEEVILDRENQTLVIRSEAVPDFLHVLKEKNDLLPDGYFAVSEEPHVIEHEDMGYLVLMEESTLPVVFVSRNRDGSLPLDVNRLSKRSVRQGSCGGAGGSTQ